MPTAISVLKYAGLLGLVVSLSACQGLEGVQVQGVDLGKLASAGQHLTNMGQKSVDEERVIGQNTATILLSKAAVLNNPPLQTYVNRVGLWVAQHSERPDLPWRFVVLDSPQVAAYAAPGGYVFITSGMLTRMNSEAELAGVLAHEVAHVVQKHHLQAIQQQAQTGLLTDLATLAVQAGAADKGGSRAGELTDRFTRSVSDLYSRGLDRGDEYEADAMGAVIAARAGYDAYGLAGVLQTLGTTRQDDAALSSFLKVHPGIDDRLQRLQPVYLYIDKTASGPTQSLDARYQQALKSNR
ncbi:M48 family metalloprotease [Pseudomonas sp. 32.2.56]|uniref:M48 family metalloprotease n=1 Tax=Pseudomonas sp. 32.2.56 TaxID=2969303 RepID=UPI00214FE1C7|nr:M48 family metalloprotease [Pseudomonas sp. 32.2.56]MCR4509667.1 M48 family metalloprotease [Pseudomonas sp. 32.2.56]